MASGYAAGVAKSLGLEHVFSCFMPINLDYPVSACESMFMFGSCCTVPYPWREVLMGMLAGDLWILSSFWFAMVGLSLRKCQLDQLVFSLLLPLRHGGSTTRQWCRFFRHPRQWPSRKSSRRHRRQESRTAQQRTATTW